MTDTLERTKADWFFKAASKGLPSRNFTCTFPCSLQSSCRAQGPQKLPEMSLQEENSPILGELMWTDSIMWTDCLLDAVDQCFLWSSSIAFFVFNSFDLWYSVSRQTRETIWGNHPCLSQFLVSVSHTKNREWTPGQSYWLSQDHLCSERGTYGIAAQ